MTPNPLAARVHALIAQWREEAKLASPPPAAPWPSVEKNARIAESRHFTNRANELEAALAAALAPHVFTQADAHLQALREIADERPLRHGMSLADYARAYLQVVDQFPAAALAPHPEKDK